MRYLLALAELLGNRLFERLQLSVDTGINDADFRSRYIRHF